MNYPLLSEYIEAIKSAEDNFDELSHLRPVLGDDGLPMITSGNFAVVFKMQDKRDGKLYAVKCFTKEQEGRAEAYREITKELKDVDSPYLTSVRYLDKELFVDTDQTKETEFPVLLMDWVEGKTLDKYLRENLDDKYALEMLAYRFCLLVQWLIPQPFAHGDLKPDNILVREEGSLVLIDYDGMYVPAMKGQKARELGSPDFRHPLRTENDFDEHIDDFPLSSLLLSLKAISIRPLLLEEFGDLNRLLFSESDYLNISRSSVMHTVLYLLSSKELALVYSVFMSSLLDYRINEEIVSAFNNRQYELCNLVMYNLTKAHGGIESEIIEDENGVKYSQDYRKLLRGHSLYKPYTINEGTEIICDNAFSGNYFWDGSGWNEIVQIIIPSSVRYIGHNPFAFCFVRIVCNTSYFVVEDNALYYADKTILIGFYGYRKESFIVPHGVKYIGNYAFAGCGLKFISLPSSVESIGDNAFQGCQLLEEIELPDNLKHIGKYAFGDCKKLKKMDLPVGLKTIGDFAFSWCTSIESITIPASVISIGVNPFLHDKQLLIYNNSYLYEVEKKTLYTKGKNFIISCLCQDLSFHIPKEVTHIGQRAFYGCPFRELFIHENINYIGKNAFDGYYYGAFPYGYRMKILVSKGKLDWVKKRISGKLHVEEIKDYD